jgi:syntaxin-binding protein 1
MGAKVVVFVAGGVTYSEMRSAYELTESAGREVIIGSSHLLTPHRYLESLAALSGGGRKRSDSDSSSD